MISDIQKIYFLKVQKNLDEKNDQISGKTSDVTLKDNPFHFIVKYVHDSIKVLKKDLTLKV